MKRFLRSTWARYSVAVLLTASMLALTQLTAWWGGNEYIPFLLAILLSARFGGLGPGLFASALAFLANDYFFISPLYSLQVQNPNDLFKLGGLALSAIIVSWLASEYRKSKYLNAVLAYRQFVIAKLSDRVLTSQDQPDLLATVAPLLCESFNVEYAGVIEFLPDTTSVMLKAGCGWAGENIGRVITGTDAEFFYGGSQFPDEPSVFDILHSKKESRIPKLLVEHNVRSGMSIVIQGNARPFGLAGVYALERRRFSEADLKFLKIFSELVSKAITRIQSMEQLREKSSGLQRTLS
ncbi:MAG: DUF4118 domain-containing protein, partial [Deltaproteobacteria bacterium]|nr:DUF4118 domain-containing protein [Deltaproteobacteria bacterium]